ncbi:hypothetical protein GCM10018953_68840 [Streptosporangium nondiastaticum]|uniref:hypothetical protein n=1 Tax=Streptosporangium nondiastaticum TaxID=35764 RepID=UPI0031F75133
MIGFRNTFAAGTTVLSIIAAPTAVPIQSAVAAIASGAVAVAPVFAGSADGAANGVGPRRVGRTLSDGVAVVQVLAGSADGAANGGGSSHGGINGDSGL